MKKIKKIGIIILSLCCLSNIPAYAMEQETTGYISSAEIKKEEIDNQTANDTAQEAIDYAVSKLGYPYSMARRHSGKAYDCSSLIYYSYLDADVDLSNEGATTAAAIGKKLINDGKEVSAEEIEPGDLIFYSYEDNGRYHNISHVAMYIGDGKQIEASYGKQEVAIRDLSFSSAVDICRPAE